MDALWAELGPEAAAANLRKAVYFACQVLGADALRLRQDVLSLQDGRLWIDVERFQAAVADGDAVTAMHLYEGELLVEDRFEPWADEPREMLRMQLVNPVARLGHLVGASSCRSGRR